MAATRIRIPLAGQAYQGNPAVALPFQAVGAAPQAEAISVIDNFCLMMNILYQYCDQVVDPAGPNRQNSTETLTEALSIYAWVFRNALDSFAAPARAAAGWVAADGHLNTLVGQLGGYPLVPLPATIPVEAPLELVYETILNVQGANDLTTGWAAITNGATNINLSASGRNGMPNVGTIVQGPALHPMLVVALNQSGFGNWNRMQSWSRNARNNCIAGNTYQRYLALHERIKRTENGAPQANSIDLENTWALAIGAPPNHGAADTAVANQWVQKCGLANAIGYSHISPPVGAVALAVSFTCHGADPNVPFGQIPITRARCERCRVVWRWPMAWPHGGYAGPTEPAVFNERPFPYAQSCSEVLMVEKSQRSGLQQSVWA